MGIATGIAGVGGGYALVPGLIYLFGAPVLHHHGHVAGDDDPAGGRGRGDQARPGLRGPGDGPPAGGGHHRRRAGGRGHHQALQARHAEADLWPVFPVRGGQVHHRLLRDSAFGEVSASSGVMGPPLVSDA
ncbi:MAG: hypothetical protein MZV70_30025 [Desulfobacterales bacterium]|nr:hypothetical protein [Desulfobacterales bacterium]